MKSDVQFGQPAPCAAEESAPQASAHQCSCGCQSGGTPELDARSISQPIRHAAIFGALGVLAPGAAMVLVAPHDPLPLLAQLEDRQPGQFTVDYLERADDLVKVKLTRS